MKTTLNFLDSLNVLYSCFSNNIIMICTDHSGLG